MKLRPALLLAAEEGAELCMMIASGVCRQPQLFWRRAGSEVRVYEEFVWGRQVSVGYASAAAASAAAAAAAAAAPPPRAMLLC